MKKNCLFLLSLLTMFITGCDWVTDEINRNTVLEYITVDVSEAKVKYRLDEKFDSSGIKIIGHYSNDKEKCEDMRLAEFSGFNSSEVCQELYVTATYNEKQTCFAISVEEVTPVSIEVKSNPKKIFYWPGEKLDLTGMFAVVNYSDGSSIELTSDMYTYNEIEGDSKDQDIILIYNANTLLKTSFTIHVRNYEITSLKLITKPNRLVYMQGEEIDFDGIELQHDISTGGAPYNIGIEECNVSPASIKDLEVSDKPYTITISLNGSKAQYEIYIVAGYVVGARMDKGFNTFYDGEKINFDDLTKFSFVEVLSKDDLPGDTIKESKFDNLKYSYNEQCDFDSAKSIDEQLNIKGTGLQKIYFYYKYFNYQESSDVVYTWSHDISVWDSKLESIVAEFKQEQAIPLEETPDLEFEKANKGEWVINGILSNGEEVVIDPAACSYEHTEDVEKIRQSIQDDKTTNSYSTKIKVTYYDIRTKKYFSVESPIRYTTPILTSVTLIHLPNIMTYAVGSKFDITGLKVKLHYSDGIPVDREVTKEDNTFRVNCEKPFTDNDIGLQIVTVYFDEANEISLSFNVSVVQDMTEGITISLKGDYKYKGLIKFRKGETYKFLTYFDILEVKKSGYIKGFENDDSLTFNLIKSGSDDILYVLYNSGNATFSTMFTSEGETSLKILEAAPVLVKMKPKDSPSNLDDYIDNASYDITYKDGSLVECKSLSDLQNKGFSLEEKEGKLEITKVIEADISESNDISFEQSINCITNITIKQSNTKEYSRGVELPEKWQFTVTVQLANGTYFTISDSEYTLEHNLSEDTNVFEDSICYVTATYKGFTATCPVRVKTNIEKITIIYKGEEINSQKEFYKHYEETDEHAIDNLYMNCFTYKISAYKSDKNKITVSSAYNSAWKFDLKSDFVIIRENTMTANLVSRYNGCIHNGNNNLYINSLNSVYNDKDSLFEFTLAYKYDCYDDDDTDVKELKKQLFENCLYVKYVNNSVSSNSYKFQIIYDSIKTDEVIYCIGNHSQYTGTEYVELKNFANN